MKDPFMFIETETTPNPDVLKFLPGRAVLDSGAMEFRDAESANLSPLAMRLFALADVKHVFLGPDFVSVTRASGADWADLRTGVIGVLMDHYASGEPALAAGGAAQEHGTGVYDGEDAEIVDQIKDLLDTRIRPAVAQDGGDILFDRWDSGDGTVYLNMRGACAGCPASTMTLKQGVENMLRHYVPEVQRVEQTL